MSQVLCVAASLSTSNYPRAFLSLSAGAGLWEQRFGLYPCSDFLSLERFVRHRFLQKEQKAQWERKRRVCVHREWAQSQHTFADRQHNVFIRRTLWNPPLHGHYKLLGRIEKTTLWNRKWGGSFRNSSCWEFHINPVPNVLYSTPRPFHLTNASYLRVTPRLLTHICRISWTQYKAP